MVIAGDEVTIAGVGLASSAVKVYFGSKEATPVSITETEVKVIVPNDINDGNITLKFDGIPTVVDGGKLQLLENGLDITKYVLQNSVQPFIDAEGSRSGNYATPASWTLNSAAFNCTKVPSASGIQGTGNASLLSVQAGWDFGSMDNGKIYQDINLPKGNYQFTLDVSECGNSSGRFAVYFVVAKGVNSIPNIVLNTWVLENTDNVLGSYRITDNKTAHHKDLDVISLNEKTQLSVGLVAQLTNQGWVKLSAIKVIWKD